MAPTAACALGLYIGVECAGRGGFGEAVVSDGWALWRNAIQAGFVRQPW